jgi:hypothetical protein
MTECQQELRAAGRPYPRTCPICGLGPCQRRPKPQVPQPDDVLMRLKLFTEGSGLRPDANPLVSMTLLHAAVAEIERLREMLTRYDGVEAAEAPKPERWWVGSVPANEVDHSVIDGIPFGVDNGLLWFRRRVAT